MSASPVSAPIEVLLVEDNPDDAFLAIRALQRAKIRNRVHVAADGDDAMDYLQRRPPYADAPTPDLILLDLDLPKRDGRIVLEEIKGDERLRGIPIIVITGSRAEEDRARSERLEADAYITKPIDPIAFLGAIKAINQFWVEIVKAP